MFSSSNNQQNKKQCQFSRLSEQHVQNKLLSKINLPSRVFDISSQLCHCTPHFGVILQVFCRTNQNSCFKSHRLLLEGYRRLGPVPLVRKLPSSTCPFPKVLCSGLGEVRNSRRLSYCFLPSPNCNTTPPLSQDRCDSLGAQEKHFLSRAFGSEEERNNGRNIHFFLPFSNSNTSKRRPHPLCLPTGSRERWRLLPCVFSLEEKRSFQRCRSSFICAVF